MKTQYTSVAVFCGSQPGSNPLYMQHAQQLGEGLAQHRIKIIYGGGNYGLMGAVANSSLQNGGEVVGVIPHILMEKEKAHKTLSAMHIVADMHTRKQMMYQLSQAIIIMAGGNGTMDELFESITWNTLRIHNKKIIVLNSAGYYDSLITHLNKMRQEGFLYVEDFITICTSPKEIIALLTKD